MLQGVPFIMASYTSTFKIQTGLVAVLTNVCVQLPLQILIIMRRIHKHVILVILVRLTHVQRVLSEQDPLAVVVVLVIHKHVRFVPMGMIPIINARLVCTKRDPHAVAAEEKTHNLVVLASTVVRRINAWLVRTKRDPNATATEEKTHKLVVPAVMVVHRTIAVLVFTRPDISVTVLAPSTISTEPM